MPVPKDKAIAGPSTTLVSISDVNLTIGKDAVKKNGKYETQLPYRIKIEDKAGNVVSDYPTTKSIFVKSWAKQFFIKTKPDENGGPDKQYVNYTHDDILLAVVTILIKNGQLQESWKDNPDVNLLEGKTFNAMVVGKDTKFLNWAMTFAANGIEIPTVEEITAAKNGTSTPVSAGEPLPTEPLY